MRVVGHDPAWAQLFAEEAHRLRRALTDGREYFRRGEPCSHHLHLAATGGSFWREQLAFRDALRADAALRQAYAQLKVELARRFPRDREAYTNGKSEFIRRAVDRQLGRAANRGQAPRADGSPGRAGDVATEPAALAR